jgi:serine/threonine protein kinase
MPLEVSRGLVQSVGHYDLLEKIADGGMGSVYRGRHRITGDTVAVKVVPSNLANNQVLLQRFEQEYKAAIRLDHPNIVRAIEYGMEGTTPYLVMEFVDGDTLGQRIERDGKLELTEALRIIAQVAQGLHKAHKEKLVHRDVKPDNILITPSGVAKLADLGLVKEAETDLNLTRTGRGLGTPQFMAPEQFRDAKNADKRCDIYSLAATLYMALTGELPFRSCSPLDAWMKKMNNEFPDPKKLVPTLPDRVDWALKRAMSADPKKRPESCREFIEDLTGRSTRKPALHPAQDASGVTPAPDLWYMIYTDDEGTTHTVKGSYAAIRHCLRDGLMGGAENVRVSRTKQGPFEPLRSTPEFRDLVVTAAALPMQPPAAPPLSESPTRASPSLQPAPSAPLFPEPPPVRRPPPPPTVPVPVYRTPAIDIGVPNGVGPKRQPGVDWLTWAVVIVLAAATFLLGLYFIKH